MNNIVAVLVSYNPNITELTATVNSVLNQISELIIVDNGSNNFSQNWFEEFKNQTDTNKLHIFPQQENLGIAAAQNIGIEWAIKSGAEFVLLLDQDSIPDSSMVKDLLNIMLSSKTDNNALPVAAVGPATVDSRTGRLSFFVTEQGGIPKRWFSPKDGSELPDYIEIGFLIASGTLISTEAIQHIGAMRSDYFIDHVDTEWCFRAKASGYRLLGAPKAKMTHQLGDEVKKIWFFGDRQVMYHSPLRDYYMFRNTLLMLCDVSMSLIWKSHFLWRLLQFAGYFLLFTENRRSRLHCMILGLFHGYKNIRGRLDCDTEKCSPLPESNFKPNH